MEPQLIAMATRVHALCDLASTVTTIHGGAAHVALKQFCTFVAEDAHPPVLQWLRTMVDRKLTAMTRLYQRGVVELGTLCAQRYPSIQ
eukprot:5970132-Amphidinium_carterae.1